MLLQEVILIDVDRKRAEKLADVLWGQFGDTNEKVWILIFTTLHLFLE